jgi:hypothetical protein
MHMINSRVCQTNQIAVWYSPSFHFSRLRTEVKGPWTRLQQAKKRANDIKQNVRRRDNGQQQAHSVQRNAKRRANGQQKESNDKSNAIYAPIYATRMKKARKEAAVSWHNDNADSRL